MKANLGIRLVYSKTPSEKTEDAPVFAWNNKNLWQMELFGGYDRIGVHFVAVADLPGQVFRMVIEERSPQLMLDTRTYPDFFSVFDSTEVALEEFRSRGIKYSRIPCAPQAGYEFSIEQLNVIKCLVEECRSKTMDNKIFILSSTRNSLEKISCHLKKYISQEISDVIFEEIIL